MSKPGPSQCAPPKKKQWVHKEDLGVWPFGVCIERLDESLEWTKNAALVQKALLWKTPLPIAPLARNKGVLLGESWPETCWLDTYGSVVVKPGHLVFRKWTPLLGTKMAENLVKSYWVRICGLPLQL